MKPGSKKATGWTAASVGVIGVVVAAIQAYGAFVEVQSRARDAREKSVAGYEALNPSIQELQDIASDSADWAEETEDELDSLRELNAALMVRVARMEGFIAAKHTDLPVGAPPVMAAIPPPAFDEELAEEDMIEEEAPAAVALPPESRERHVPTRPKKRTPDSIDTAQKALYD